MARLKLSLKFPYLRDDTRLILHESTLYKVKIRYDQKSFKGRPVMFTTTELSNEIEEVIRAVMYMFRNNVGLQPIETKYFLILPKLTEWVFPTKYPNYVFKKHNKTLETCDHMIELFVKHVNEITEQDESEKSEESQTVNARHETRKTQRSTTENDGENKITGGSRFIRDEDGKLQRVQSGQSEVVQNKQSSHAKNNSQEYTREMRKRTSDKTITIAYDPNKSKMNKTSQSSVDDKNRLHTNVKQTNDIAVTKRVKQPNSKLATTSKVSKKQISLEGSKPQTCVDCLEEHQFRRRSGRLKSKGENSPKNEKQTVKTNKEDSSSTWRSTIPADGQRQEENDIRDIDFGISPIKRPKRNMNGLNSNNNSELQYDTEVKRRKRMGNSKQASPTAVYRDMLQNRNRDRYVLEQLERKETNKLGELYAAEAPRRSLRQAEKAGRLSGLWNKIWDTFFTPKK